MDEKTYSPPLYGRKFITILCPDDKVIHKIIVSFTPYSLCFHPPRPPYPLFEYYLQSKEILLNLSMRWWNSAFNAHGLRVIIVVV